MDNKNTDIKEYLENSFVNMPIKDAADYLGVDVSSCISRMFDEGGYRYDWFSRGMEAYATRFK